MSQGDFDAFDVSTASQRHSPRRFEPGLKESMVINR